MSLQVNFSTHGWISRRLSDSVTAWLLISLTDPDVESVTKKDLGFTDACGGIVCR